MLPFKCPHCKGPLEFKDVVYQTDNTQFDYDILRIHISTIILHRAYLEPECGNFIQSLIREMNDTLRKRIEFVQGSQEIPGV